MKRRTRSSIHPKSESRRFTEPLVKVITPRSALSLPRVQI